MHLLGQLYISLQVREGTADTLFEVENTDVPPSLSNHGNLRSGQKSDLVSGLETSDFDEADMKCIDGNPTPPRSAPGRAPCDAATNLLSSKLGWAIILDSSILLVSLRR